PRREHPVPRGRSAAALYMTEHGDARLEAGALLDLPPERLAAAALAEDHVPELILLTAVREPGQLAALADDHDGEVLPAGVPLPDRLRDYLEVDLARRHEDLVGPPGDAAHHGDPTGLTAHHLDDHDAVVRLGGRVEPFDRLGRDEDRGVEAEGVVRAREVVVDRLGDADDRELMLGVQARCDAERVLAADRDERIETAIREVLQYALDTALELERVRAARADDRAAAREDPGDLRGPEVLEDRIHETAPAL